MQHPFQLRDHGGNVIEMIVIEEIRSDHKVAEALRILINKFDYVILSLSESASLHPSFSQTMADLAATGKLLVVAREDNQVAIEMHEVKRFKEVHEAEHRVEGERHVQRILEQLKKMSPLQSSAHKLMQMLRNPDVKFEEIEEVTRNDPKLTMRMLKISNSAFFMRRMPFGSLKSVVAFLGIEGIRQIILQETFEGFAKFFANQRDKLAHMRRCSHLTAHIGKLLGGDQVLVGKMLSAGLLHDLGALMLCYYDSDEYARVTRMVRNDKKTITEAEIEVFGIDHQELGQILIPKMGMPDFLAPIMAKHHNKSIPTGDLVLPAVMIANGYLNQHIEKLPSFTPYEQFLPAFAEERRTKKMTASIGKKSGDSKMADIAAAKEEEGDVFAVPHIFEVLKKELDKYILSGSEAHGI
ncbi:MAG TPA: HDOD domain-containing protein [Candidatus Rifleibacterium sp.]|nr:HDOD domain-containing protein [Candidatus Ozemobacteraceae bacterium]HNW09746.1 HDOD domain-containing protein [Candidatus Rifleibacterium sp.]HPW57012.1 HDOD domain-containing protein [Candidatus Rifleibacterium sp.]